MFREAEVAKLPKWAQDKVKEMQNRLTAAEQVVETFGRKDTSTSVTLSHSIPPIGVPEMAIFRVGLPDDRSTHIEVRREIRQEEGYLSVYVSASSQLEILPAGGTNTVNIRIKLR